jgi:hypothetical protein
MEAIDSCERQDGKNRRGRQKRLAEEFNPRGMQTDENDEPGSNVNVERFLHELKHRSQRTGATPE